MLEVLVFGGVLLLIVVAVAWLLWPRRDRTPEPAPLESNTAREAVRAAIERRYPDH